MIVKANLTERKRGKGGTIVALKDGRIVVVKDLMQRPNYDKPGRIGVGPVDRGIAFGVELVDIAAIVA